MNKVYPFDELQTLLNPAQNILVLLPNGANFDQIAAGLALSLSLGKAGKQVSVLSAEEMRVEFSHLVGVDKITSQASSGDLILTVDVPIENVEKVSSQDDGSRLCLVVKSKAGFPPITKEQIIFEQGSAAADLLFVIEARKLESLGKLYQENQNLFQEKPLISVSHYPKAEALGKINIIDPAASCACEIVAGFLSGLNLPLDEDIAGNLLLGLRQATGNFQSPATTAETFEAAAFCARYQTRTVGKGEIPPKKGEEIPAMEAVTPEEPPTPSPDWFEPKIYKGSTLP